MRVVLTAFICGAFGNAQALPFGEQVQAGNLSFERGAQFLNINQTSQKAIANWQSFSIAANESVRLNQPAQGVALFRVIGNDPSQIYGSLRATGSLFLSNPNGVLFGLSAQVDVGSLVATSMRINDSDFLAGNYQFHADGNASLVNEGVIRTEVGGYIALLGSTIENSGTLQANNGSVILGTAQSAMLDFYGDGLVRVKLDGDALNAVINQTGNIIADGGAVQLATSARTAAINVDGLVQANSLVERNGVIRLEGGKNARVSVSGTLSAAGNETGTTGGRVEITGEQVALFNGAKLDASGNVGGGTVLVGGDYQGKNALVYNSRTTYVDKDVSINVDAKNNGNGGKAIVWAEEVTRYYGSISAKGGENVGNGGFSEVSGKRLLNFLGKADLSAVNGLGGSLLLDPLNITLTTADVNTAGFTLPGDITEAFADDAGLTSTFRVNAGGSFAGIAAGSTITLQATNDITVASAFNVATATGSANNSLVLQANNNINVNAAVTTTGTGSITMTANADNLGAGNLAIGANNLASQMGGITLSGVNITKTTGTIISTGAASANGGNINIIATGTANLGTGAITANGGAGAAATAGGNAGNVTITAAGAITTGAVTATGGAAGAGNAAGGNAGAINISTTVGNITTGALAASTGAATGTGSGGAVGGITVNNTAIAGNVTLGALTTSGGANGNAGTISANAAGVLTLNGAIAANAGNNVAATIQAGKNAGAITLTGNSIALVAAATINANGGNGLGANQNGGNGAAVNLNATGAISVRAITANGGNGVATNAAGGNAGSITIATNAGDITTNAGALTARTGTGIGTGADSAQGFVTVNNTSVAGIIATGAINTSGQTNGHGGNINVTGNGNVTVTGTVSSSGGASTGLRTGRNAGNLTITGVNRLITGAITANGGAAIGAVQAGGNAGVVSITGVGTLNTVAINAQAGSATTIGAGGATGGITLNGSTVVAGTLTTTGGSNGNAGNIGVTSTASMTVGAIAANGGGALAGVSGRNAGTVTLNSAGAVTATTIAAAGTNGNGATLNLAGGNAAAINVTGVGGIITTAISASGGAGTTTNAAGGNAGAITITNSGTGNIAVTTLAAQTGAATGTGTSGTAANILVTNTATGGNLTATNITTTGGANGNGGNVTLSSLGTTTAGTIAASGATSTGIRVGRVGGNVAVSGAAVTTSAITANGANGVGLNQAGGNAGAVSLTASTGTVVTQAISAVGGAGVATNANGGNGGAVVLDAGAGSSITMNNINTTGGNRAGTGTAGNGGNTSVADNALLSANTTITATGGAVGGTSGAINFAGTINSLGANRTLAVNTTAVTTLTGAIGNSLALASLTTNAGGTTAINGGTVITTGAQTYNDATTLGTATTFTTTNSAVNFASSVNAGGNNVVIAAGTGAVTANNSANNFGNLAITAGSANIRDSGAIVLGATNVTGAYTLQSGASVTQSAAVIVGGTTTLISGASDVTLNNPLNDFNAVTINSARDVNIVDANALTIGTSAVKTLAARTISNNLTLAGNVTATGAGDAIVLASAANFINSANNTLTPGTGRWLVYSTSPLLDTRGALLTTNYDFKQYNTAFGGSILGAGDGFIYTLAPTITPTLSGTATKGYDGNNTAPIGSLALGQTGAIDGDSIVLSGLSSATYDNKNAGTGKTVSATGISLASATNGAKPVFGYQLASTTATGAVGTINQRAITVTAATDTKTYDANTNSAGAPTLTSGSIVSGDSAAFSQTFDNKNAGTGKTLTAAGTVTDGNGGANYAVTFVTDNTGVINQRALAGAITANNKTYDATTAATIATRSLTGVIGSDDVTYTGGTATFDNKNVSTGKTVIGTGLGLSGADAGNYTVNTTAATTADIAKADITAVTGITANNKVYDATTAASLNTGAAAYTGKIAGDNLTVATVIGNFSDANAGLGKTVNISGISLGGADAGNYNLTTTTASTAADISQRAITVTANPGQSKIFGAADPLPFAFTVGGLGLVGADTLTGALDRAAGEVVGSYAINQGSLLASSNYLLTYVGNNFNILTPSTTGSGNPRNGAGLVDLNPALGNYTNQQLFVLNVGATAAGVDSEGNQQACEGDPETLAKDKEFVLMLNYGLNLPKGVNTSCDKATL